MALSLISKISHPSYNPRVLSHLVGLTLCGSMNCIACQGPLSMEFPRQ